MNKKKTSAYIATLINLLAEKENPDFFNKNNTAIDWATRKLPNEFKRRGIVEGLHGISNPILTHPKIRPGAERFISRARMNAARMEPNWYGRPIKTILGLPLRRDALQRGMYIDRNPGRYRPEEAEMYETFPQIRR